MIVFLIYFLIGFVSGVYILITDVISGVNMKGDSVLDIMGVLALYGLLMPITFAYACYVGYYYIKYIKYLKSERENHEGN